LAGTYLQDLPGTYLQDLGRDLPAELTRDLPAELTRDLSGPDLLQGTGHKKKRMPMESPVLKRKRRIRVNTQVQIFNHL